MCAYHDNRSADLAFRVIPAALVFGDALAEPAIRAAGAELKSCSAAAGGASDAAARGRWPKRGSSVGGVVAPDQHAPAAINAAAAMLYVIGRHLSPDVRPRHSMIRHCVSLYR